MSLVSYLIQPVFTDEVTFTIKSVYPGTDFHDTCVTEISFDQLLIQDAYFNVKNFIRDLLNPGAILSYCTA